jgi:hypothetical protein
MTSGGGRAVRADGVKPILVAAAPRFGIRDGPRGHRRGAAGTRRSSVACARHHARTRRPMSTVVHVRSHDLHRHDAHEHDAGGDHVGSVDQLIARVAGRLRRARTPLPEEQLRRLAEDVVLDTVRFALGWVESPVGGAAPSGDAP